MCLLTQAGSKHVKIGSHTAENYMHMHNYWVELTRFQNASSLFNLFKMTLRAEKRSEKTFVWGFLDQDFPSGTFPACPQLLTLEVEDILNSERQTTGYSSNIC